jgi:hypothetical protein
MASRTTSAFDYDNQERNERTAEPRTEDQERRGEDLNVLVLGTMEPEALMRCGVITPALTLSIYTLHINLERIHTVKSLHPLISASTPHILSTFPSTFFHRSRIRTSTMAPTQQEVDQAKQVLLEHGLEVRRAIVGEGAVKSTLEASECVLCFLAVPAHLLFLPQFLSTSSTSARSSLTY